MSFFSTTNSLWWKNPYFYIFVASPLCISFFVGFTMLWVAFTYSDKQVEVQIPCHADTVIYQDAPALEARKQLAIQIPKPCQ